MRKWFGAGGIVEGPEGLLLVQNKRRGGTLDWSTPGGVIEEGESAVDALTREVLEETGITVTSWDGPLYDVEAVADDMGWHLRVEVYRATEFTGEIVLEDVDGIVVDAQWMDVDSCRALEGCPLWVHEPLLDWLGERFAAPRTFRYRVSGVDRANMTVRRDEQDE